MTPSLGVELTCSQPSLSRSQYITRASHDNTTINSWKFINQGVCAPRGTLRAFPNYDSISAKLRIEATRVFESLWEWYVAATVHYVITITFP